jgi:hypothetical protein
LFKETVPMRRYLFLVLAASCALTACEGARNNSSWSDRKEGTGVVPELKKAAPIDTTAAHADSADTTQDKH